MYSAHETPPKLRLNPDKLAIVLSSPTELYSSFALLDQVASRGSNNLFFPE